MDKLINVFFAVFGFIGIVAIAFDIQYPSFMDGAILVQIDKKVDSTLLVDTFLTAPPVNTFEHNEVIEKVKTERKTPVKSRELSVKEWYPYYPVWYYKYDKIEADSNEINEFTNILFTESGSQLKHYDYDYNVDIDRYLVAIVAIRTIHSKVKPYDKVKTLKDMFRNGQFKKESSLPKYHLKEWRKCREVIVDVLNCEIPAEVPYIPHGTFCYWNSRLDTNKKQKAYLENNGYHVATTGKDHHYFAIKGYINQDELTYLKRNPCSYAITNGSKNIKGGLLCNKKIIK